MEAILLNKTQKLLSFEISNMLTAVFKNKFIVLLIIIFGILSFPIGVTYILKVIYCMSDPKDCWTVSHKLGLTAAGCGLNATPLFHSNSILQSQSHNKLN